MDPTVPGLSESSEKNKMRTALPNNIRVCPDAPRKLPSRRVRPTPVLLRSARNLFGSSQVRVLSRRHTSAIYVPADYDVDITINDATGATTTAYVARATMADLNNYFAYHDRTGDVDITVKRARDAVGLLSSRGGRVWGKRITPELVAAYIEYLRGYNDNDLIKNVCYRSEDV